MSKEEINRIISYIGESLDCDNFASGFDNFIEITDAKKVSYFVPIGIVPGFDPYRDCYPKGMGVLDWFEKYPVVIDRMKRGESYNCEKLQDLKD